MLWSFVLIAVLSLFMLRAALFAVVADGQDANAVVATERRKAVYSPVLSEKATRTIYRLKKAYKKPMTEIAESLIQQSLKAVEKEVICEVCIADKNNECNECYLK
jgi:RecB family exonuclease